jgi:hypothetical protein
MDRAAWARILRADLARLCALLWLVSALAMPFAMAQAKAQASLDALLAEICRGDPLGAPAPDGGKDGHAHEHGLSCCLPGHRIVPALAAPGGGDAVPPPPRTDGLPRAWVPPPQSLPGRPPLWRPQSPRAPPVLT